MDFVVDLPPSNCGEVICRNIMTVTDRFSKERHLILVGEISVDVVASLFLRFVFARHGLPNTIVLDRDPRFMSAFWQRLCQMLRIDHRASSTYHPESNGQSERTNQSMEHYLRAFVSYAQTDWAQWLPLAEFAANNQVSESTGISPFFATTGRNPRFTIDVTPSTQALPTRSVQRAMLKDAERLA